MTKPTTLSVIKRAAIAAVLASGSLLSLSAACLADDPDLLAGTTVFAGGDARNRQEYPYIGFVHHFTGNLTDDGYLLTFFGDYAWYRYHSPASPSGTVRGQAPAFDIMPGYQYVAGIWTLRGYVGFDYEHHYLVPRNPADTQAGSHAGVNVQGEAETAYDFPYYGSLIGSFGSAVDRYWGRLRVGYNSLAISAGPEVIGAGDDEYQEQRVGAFLNVKSFLPVLLSFSVGYARTSPSRGGSTPYGTFEISTSF